MKNLFAISVRGLLIFIPQFFVVCFSFAGAPRQNVIDSWYALAMSLKESDFSNRGRYACLSDVGGEPVVSYGKNLDVANTEWFLKCLKHECKRISEKVEEGFRIIGELSGDEYLSFLTGMLGLSESDARRIVEAQILKKDDFSKRPVRLVSCNSATELQRMVTYDGCATQPRRCLRSREYFK